MTADVLIEYRDYSYSDFSGEGPLVTFYSGFTLPAGGRMSSPTVWPKSAMVNEGGYAQLCIGSAENASLFTDALDLQSNIVVDQGYKMQCINPAPNMAAATDVYISMYIGEASPSAGAFRVYFEYVVLPTE